MNKKFFEAGKNIGDTFKKEDQYGQVRRWDDWKKKIRFKVGEKDYFWDELTPKQQEMIKKAALDNQWT